MKKKKTRPPRKHSCHRRQDNQDKSGLASRHSISTRFVYAEHYGNFRAQCQNKTELLLTARFSLKFLGKFHVVSPSLHVWLVVHQPIMPLSQFQKISDVAYPNKAIPKFGFLFYFFNLPSLSAKKHPIRNKKKNA